MGSVEEEVLTAISPRSPQLPALPVCFSGTRMRAGADRRGLASAFELGTQKIGASPSERALEMQTIAGIGFTITADADTNPANPHPYGYVTPGAQVGEFGLFAEWERGIAEFPLAGVQAGQATLSFAYTSGEIDRMVGHQPLTVGVSAQDGNLQPTIQTYFTPGLPWGGGTFTVDVGQLGIVGLTPYGTTFSFDVTQPLQVALDRGDTALGFSFNFSNAQSWVDSFVGLGNFTLSVDSQLAAPVPEPSMAGLMTAGLMVGWMIRKISKRRTSGNRRCQTGVTL